MINQDSWPAAQVRQELLTAREAAEYLRISLSTLNRMEKSHIIQGLRTPGGHRRYTLAMLNACLSTGEVNVER
jgi:excisionase family DNA binding protein